MCRFRPRPYHTALPGYVYGGLIASLIDCHATGTAAAATYREEAGPWAPRRRLRFVTASLHVDYLAPTPIDTVLELRGRVKEIKGKKVSVAVSLSADGTVCARGEVVTVQMPPDWVEKLKLKGSRGPGVKGSSENFLIRNNLPFSDAMADSLLAPVSMETSGL